MTGSWIWMLSWEAIDQLVVLVTSWISPKGVLCKSDIRMSPTVPPIEASSTPSDTGSTANLGFGKLMSTEVEMESETESR